MKDLSDESYFIKLQESRNLFDIEDLKSTLHSVINLDFIKDVFLKTESYILNDFQNKLPEHKINVNEYKTTAEPCQEKSIHSMKINVWTQPVQSNIFVRFIQAMSPRYKTILIILRVYPIEHEFLTHLPY
ncbi:hypothetical protein RF11_08488 [Thelohanellus kitauei]|uniref:Uncharacterized protein n=1 Tax=Thelohanellus kitauei TaxID=669202 RepID=A0A0C2NCX1_THEKT|nr:hypothetical protein RF11_08488 [Thelohanellus kitauei]